MGIRKDFINSEEGCQGIEDIWIERG